MTIEIVDRLQRTSNMIALGEKIQWGSDSALMEEAALTIQSLVKALEPFAEIADDMNPDLTDSTKIAVGWAIPSVGDLRRARAEITKLRGGSHEGR